MPDQSRPSQRRINDKGIIKDGKRKNESIDH